MKSGYEFFWKCIDCEFTVQQAELDFFQMKMPGRCGRCGGIMKRYLGLLKREKYRFNPAVQYN